MLLREEKRVLEERPGTRDPFKSSSAPYVITVFDVIVMVMVIATIVIIINQLVSDQILSLMPVCLWSVELCVRKHIHDGQDKDRTANCLAIKTFRFFKQFMFKAVRRM